MKIARAIQKLIDAFEKLPGIGPKTAQRLTFYLLHVPQEQLDQLAEAASGLKKNTKMCSLCFNISETDPCLICSDPARDKTKICVVEQPLDILAIEKANTYKGLYHVLHGAINPLDNIGPEQLHMHDLLPRLREGTVSELIIATNPTMEGEATAMYLTRMIRKSQQNQQIRITRIGRGLPTGADLEYADETTLARSFEGRREY
ncbi:MAG TPA: recombination mediator RecR [Candidatus Bathyarchaeia archaeon]|nr:recombination mediator RecR [Candidatus Bathyarchaeia archaeon]